MGGLWSVLRPVVLLALAPVALLGIVSGSLDSESVGLLALFALATLLDDLRQAHATWHRSFHAERPDDAVDLTRRDSDRASAPSLVMHRLTFPQWLRYWFTLRIDYIVNDLARGPRFWIRRTLVDRGWKRARRWTRYYRPHWERVDRQLAEVVLETSLVIGVRKIERVEGREIGVFEWNDWWTTAGPDFDRESLRVQSFSVTIDLAERKAIAASLNGAPLEIGRDALTIAVNALVLYLHPTVHAHANLGAHTDHDDAELARGAIYTLAMNAVAWHPGSIVVEDAVHMRRILSENAAKGMFAHGRGHLHRELPQWSRLARFLARARPAAMAVVRRHRVDIDPESFFLMSVMHSIDHHACAVAVDPIDLRSGLLGHDGTQWIRALFVEPLRPLLADTRLSRARAPWLRELYGKLREIDAEYADVVDTCIRY